MEQNLVQSQASGRKWLRLGFLVSAMGLSPGCSWIQRTVELPGRAMAAIVPGLRDEAAFDPVELVGHLMRFADDLIATTTAASEGLSRGTKAISRVELQTLRISYATEVVAIATGPNALSSLLDMVVMVTLSRMRVEDYWLPEIYGESARPLLKAFREAEGRIWKIANTILNVTDQQELRNAIKTWHDQNAGATTVGSMVTIDFASEVAKVSPKRKGGSPSVFTLLGIDPLSGLDPATRELAQTRLFGERALFMARRIPVLIEWNMELFAFKMAEMPELQRALTTSTQLAASIERFSVTAEQLPRLISTEREQIIKAVSAQQQGLTRLAAEVRQALATGTRMGDATQRTLKTFQEVVVQLDSGEPDPNSEPFRIRDYTEAAAQLDTTAERLLELLQAFDRPIASTNLARVSSQFGALTQQAQSSGKEVMDYAFRKAVVLVLICCGAVFTTALLYRVLTASFALIPKRKNGRAI